jgi:diguanylate cyclase (GGDEF)-like protein/PAS domain S-box-containing protein
MGDASVDMAQFAAALGRADQLSEILNGLGEAVYLVDRERTIRVWNTASEKLSGYRAEEVVGHRCFEDILRHIDDQGRRLCFEDCPLAATIKDGCRRQCRVWLHHRDGHRIPVRLSTQPIRDHGGAIIGAIETFSDDSSLEAMRARLQEMEELAMVDPLTEIPNRRYLEMVLTSRLAEARRYRRALSIALFDFDDFKLINDRYGHATGDAALRVVATVLAANERADDIVARLAGDEFVVVLHNADRIAATKACQRLRMLIASSELKLGHERVRLAASFGVATATPRDQVASILQRADRKLYRAKEQRPQLIAV